MRSLPFSLCLLCCTAGVFQAASASTVRKAVDFSVTQDVGFGNEVCVTGTHPALGGGNVLRAPKLAWNPGNVWRASIALPAGETVTFRYVSRSYAVSAWGNAALRTNLGEEQTVTVPPHPPAPWGGKVVFLQAPWTEAYLLYRDVTHNGAWIEVAMREDGPGRNGAERIFRAEGLAPAGAELEFVFRNASNTYLNAPAPPRTNGGSPAVPVPYQSLAPPYNFRTPLDVFFVQDQQVFNYRPPATVSAPRTEVRAISSTVSGIPGRPITIVLPRGYDQNTGKKYPVVYFHDGQNVFYPGGPFGTWDADRIAAYETSQGRMREAILVAVPNGNAYGSDRLQEYLPEGDTITLYGGTTVNHIGRASAYLQFLLANVAPTLDGNYRTLGDAANTFIAGSSMGGLVSDFIGRSRSDRFGGAGIFSPAYWAAPNFAASRDAAGRQPVRRFLSMGTAESSTGESSSTVYWQDALRAYNSYVRQGHPVGSELVFVGVAGGAHNEAAWSALLPQFFAFLLDPWQEAQPLSLEVAPPKMELRVTDPVTRSLTFGFTARRGLAHTVETATRLGEIWTPIATVEPADDAWEDREETVTFPADGSQFWRLRVTSW